MQLCQFFHPPRSGSAETPKDLAMTTECVLMPTRTEVETFFCSLFGTDILAKETDNSCSEEQYVVAEYSEPNGDLRYLIAIDYELANGLGAALTVIPPAVAKESAEKHIIPDNIRENLQEVLNVCTSLFSVGMSGHHIAISGLHEKGATPETVTEALSAAEATESFLIDLPRYQAGTMTVYRMPHEDEAPAE